MDLKNNQNYTKNDNKANHYYFYIPLYNRIPKKYFNNNFSDLGSNNNNNNRRFRRQNNNVFRIANLKYFWFNINKAYNINNIIITHKKTIY